MMTVAPSSLLDEAVALARAGRFAEAETLAQRRLAAAPDDADAFNVLGGVARARGESARAEECYSEALRRRPGFAKAHNNLGAVLLEAGRIEDAIANLRGALESDPDFTDARVNLGTALVNAGNYAEAERELGIALNAAPDDALALNSLGNALFHQGRSEDAIVAFERAIACEPTLAMALNNLGTAWREAGERGKAESMLRRAIAMDDDFAEAWSALGVVLREQGRTEEAIAAQERALAAKPGFPPALFSRAIIALGEGRFADGFRDYRARPLPEREQVFRDALEKDLSGKRVLLLPNQGLGDELFFLRFALAWGRRGAVLTYRAGPAVASIVSRSGAVDRVLAEGEPEPDRDRTLSIGDLPHALGVGTGADLPPPLALPAEEAELAKIAAEFARLGPPPYVGLTWRAGTRAWNALLKAVPVAALGRALAGLPATFLSLQRGPDAGEIEALSAALGAPAHDLSGLNRSLETMLALLHRIDAYVGVSNTNTHLRAGTGRIGHVLVSHPAEWRWMNAGERSPWFPDFPLYRQRAAEDAEAGWDEALGRLRGDLAAFLRVA
jgi:tetratricopeptide (TPR) repeat protein